MSVNTKMYIPKGIKVGYQNREDCYTGKLAYVVYVDDKGKLRKEKSWQGWRNKKIKPDDFNNEPTEGFVLNRKAGGVGSGWGWNDRIEKVRVYDPRDFEFEISIPNLLFILQECSAIKGKGLEGEFVYAWSGTELILLPVGSSEYEECVKHTQRQSVKMTKEDMKEGFSYIFKDGTEAMYLGRLAYNNPGFYKKFNPKGKKHIFLRLSEKRYYSDGIYIAESGYTKVAECTSPAALASYPDELDKFKASEYNGEVKDVSIRKLKWSDANALLHKTLLVKEGDEFFAATVTGYTGYRSNYKTLYCVDKSTTPFKPELKNGTVKVPEVKVPYRGVGSGSAFYGYRKDYIDAIKEGMKESELKKIEFYTVVTEKGKQITIGR